LRARLQRCFVARLAIEVAQVRTTIDPETEEICQRLVDECHPKQRALVLDPGRRVAARTARGCGKTTALLARFLRRMLTTPNARCLYFATTRDHALELLWEPLKTVAERFGIEATFHETRLVMRLQHNGAQLRLVGADDKKQIEKYRGLPHHEVWIDEAASFPIKLLEHLIDRVISPRLGDFGGMLGLVGTPGHILAGPFYDATRSGSELHRPYVERDLPEHEGFIGWSFHHFTLHDGAPHIPAMARLLAEALIEKKSKQWSDDHPVWLREYCGQWAADDTLSVFRYRIFAEDGTLWNQWDPERIGPLGIATLPAEFTDWEYVYGMDIGGASDPCAFTSWAFSPTDPLQRLFQVWEHEARGMYARSMAVLLIGPQLDAESPSGVIGVTGWPIGFVADRDGAGDAVLKELGLVYGIAIEPADKKNYFDSVELFNGDCIDGRIKVLKGSKLETQLLEQQWKIDDDGKLKKNKGQRDDLTDTAIYARRKAFHLFAAHVPPPESVDYVPPTDGEWREHAAPDDPFGDYLDDRDYDWSAM